ncbi:flagellar basal body-associated FliL family protein [Marinobacter daqiaonensis]|nr:flagellar basal body-associated FliL family protein [Marinobacter daqiaonensis]
MKQTTTFWLMLVLTALLPVTTLAQDNEENTSEEEPGPRFTDYVEMTPAFVTHVGPPTERPSYLKTDISLRVGTETARAAIETHMPRLRHELVMLFGEQSDLDVLASPIGQKDLREQALERINQVMEEQRTGETVVDVLFTTFVVQRS